MFNSLIRCLIVHHFIFSPFLCPHPSSLPASLPLSLSSSPPPTTHPPASLHARLLNSHRSAFFSGLCRWIQSWIWCQARCVLGAPRRPTKRWSVSRSVGKPLFYDHDLLHSQPFKCAGEKWTLLLMKSSSDLFFFPFHFIFLPPYVHSKCVKEVVICRNWRQIRIISVQSACEIQIFREVWCASSCVVSFGSCSAILQAVQHKIQ